MIKKIRDWLRGYTDEDIVKFERKLAAAVLNATPGGCIKLNAVEMKIWKARF